MIQASCRKQFVRGNVPLDEFLFDQASIVLLQSASGIGMTIPVNRVIRYRLQP